jgi:hypothetical protein
VTSLINRPRRRSRSALRETGGPTQAAAPPKPRRAEASAKAYPHKRVLKLPEVPQQLPLSSAPVRFQPATA